MFQSLINISGDALDCEVYVLLSGLVKTFKFLILHVVTLFKNAFQTHFSNLKQKKAS